MPKKQADYHDEERSNYRLPDQFIVANRAQSHNKLVLYTIRTFWVTRKKYLYNI